MSQEDIMDIAKLTLKVGDVDVRIEIPSETAEQLAAYLYAGKAGEVKITLEDEAGAQLGVVGSLYDSEARDGDDEPYGLEVERAAD
jgi:hypothetical protein